MTTPRRFNFGAGPSAMPESVLAEVQGAIWDLAGTGVGILEHSHREAAFERVLDDAEARARRLFAVPTSHAIVFVTGVASQHFHLVPMNFLPPGGTADYVHTGAWSGKALEEARRGRPTAAVHLAGDATAGGCRAIPTCAWSAAPAYAHYTSNETIHGTQWPTPPTPPTGTPLVCDASSDLGSRPIDVGAHHLIYAGAQKNLGAAGIAMVFVERAWAEAHGAELPPLLRYHTYVRDRSLTTTPNTFGVFVLGRMLAWIEAEGGLAEMARRAEARAAAIYAFLDASPVFTPCAAPGSRSRMNVTFRARTAELEAKALEACDAAGLVGLRGHRSVGGLRASLYNATPAAALPRLLEVLGSI